MAIIKFKHSGRIDFKCDDCERICYTPYGKDGKLLKNFLKWKKWLRFQDGRTYCPVCLKKRRKATQRSRISFATKGIEDSWLNHLKRNTGIENEAVLYRLWQLRGAFPEAYVGCMGTGVFIGTNWEHATISISYDGRMGFTTTFGPVCQFA